MTSRSHRRVGAPRASPWGRGWQAFGCWAPRPTSSSAPPFASSPMSAHTVPLYPRSAVEGLSGRSFPFSAPQTSQSFPEPRRPGAPHPPGPGAGGRCGVSPWPQSWPPRPRRGSGAQLCQQIKAPDPDPPDLPLCALSHSPPNPPGPQPHPCTSWGRATHPAPPPPWKSVGNPRGVLGRAGDTPSGWGLTSGREGAPPSPWLTWRG